jgi:hypothetical protein
MWIVVIVAVEIHPDFAEWKSSVLDFVYVILNHCVFKELHRSGKINGRGNPFPKSTCVIV